MPICAASAGTKEPDLRQDGDQRVLAQEGAFAGHVGAGEQPEPLRLLQVAIVGDEARPRGALQRRLDHRMAAAV